MDIDQQAVCASHSAVFSPPQPNDKVGISASALRGERPIHGLRHQPEAGTSGWFIWAGELSSDPDFFSPLHYRHLVGDCPDVLPFMALPPGWRFLVTPGQEDVWFDPALLNI